MNRSELILSAQVPVQEALERQSFDGVWGIRVDRNGRKVWLNGERRRDLEGETW